MKLVFYSVVLNHHQAPVADALYATLGKEYAFVEITNIGDSKGGSEDYSNRPYLLQAWRDECSYKQAWKLLHTAEVCVFGGTESFSYLKERLKYGLLSFQMGERWLKQGWKNLLSPRLQRFFWTYHLYRWKHKPLYKLCASAFTASDDKKLGMFQDKCYKWGYFTRTECLDFPIEPKPTMKVRIMWCARFLKLKHPELVIHLAQKLKIDGYCFQLDMYGDGKEKEKTESLAKELDVLDVVQFKGNVSNDKALKAMQEHDIFLFTSDKNEGWGAVANESMSCGCALIGADEIGSIPYLVEDGVTGCIFQTNSLNSLVEKVKFLLDNPEKRYYIQKAASRCIQNVWSPKNAADNLLKLIKEIQAGSENFIAQGPGSKA